MENPSEVDTLYQDILINVTSFFREPEAYDALKSSVFPQITGKTSSDLPIRLWIPGCSTGEEAYSLAICLLEFLSDKKLSRPVQIFATDIDEGAIETARKGIYPESIAKDVTQEKLRRFFVKTQNGYEISKAIREMCIFARQNLVKDPPFSKIDLISCRNVLIYFGPVLQKKALPIMHYALKPSGFLMLGTSETIGDFSSDFALVDKKNKIFSKKHSMSRLHFEQPSEEYARPPVPTFAASSVKPVSIVSDILSVADSIVMDRFGPAGVVINEEMKVLQFRGYTSPYLEHGPGEASLNLMKLCREGLMLELSRALQVAKKENAPVKKEGVRVVTSREGELSPQEITLQVIPFNAPSTEDLCFLVLFEETIRRPPGVETGVSASPEDAGEIRRLQQELSSAREYLATVTAEHEAGNEELMALNEELQSSNEEMQSINEELETAKEELQSTNEELTTVNDELQSRNEEMTLVNNDLVNVLSGIEIPVVLLGSELQIRRFNPSAGKILNLIASDAGRPITDIRSNINVPNIKEMIAGVIDSLTIKEQEIQDAEGRWYSMTIRPYKTLDNRIEGVLMTFFDINDLKLAEAEREILITELKEALASVKQLSGMLPICAACKMIRDDKGYWTQIESYITGHSEALFTHGLCPDCANKALEEIGGLKKRSEGRETGKRPDPDSKEPE
jgi:two-component system CheB/CheR fusion protein